MGGNTQPDGRPLGGSELRSYFSRLWTKVHRMKFACAGVSTDDVLLRSGDIRDQVAKLCKIAPKF